MTALPGVYLLGDSIRFGATGKTDRSPGYEPFVRAWLQSQARVYGPPENCRFTVYTLRYLHQWARDIPPEAVDVVHWNNGLWDVARFFGDEPLVPLEVYCGMLRRICGRIRMLFPRARVVFALSTPVVEAEAPAGMARRNGDIRRYNAAAAGVMAELGVEIDDLYTVAEAFGGRHRADWVHFDREGCRLLARAVVRSLGFSAPAP